MVRSDEQSRPLNPARNPTTLAASRFAAHAKQRLWRSLAVTAALITMSVLIATVPTGIPPSALWEGLRVGLLGAAAVTLGLVAWQQHRVQLHLVGLATWPAASEDDDASFLQDGLRHVRRLHQAHTVVLIREKQERGIQIDICNEQDAQAGPESPSSEDLRLAGALVGASFFCNDWVSDVNSVVFRSPVGLQRWRGHAVQGSVKPWLKGKRVLSAPLTIQSSRGRLFVLDGRRGSRSELFFVEAVAKALATRLEERHLAERARHRAIVDERGRFSRDLHDGLLQSMSAWSLQIGDVARRVEEVDIAAANRLHDLRRQIAADQRELRTSIGRLRSEMIEPVDFSLIGRLHDLRDRFAEEWGLTVHVDFSGLHALVPTALRAEVCRLVHEALANAARHSQTTLVRVEVAASDAGVFVSVRDRGRGFPFHGRFELARLRQEGRGPSSLIERVLALGGELVVESSAAGASVEILLPLDQPRGRATEHAS
jgi:signal transduction histidine kinase